MRVLIVNVDYAEFLEDLYAREPGLAERSFAEQTQHRAETLFGVGDFYSSNLRALGHEAIDIHVNNRFAQAAWTREHAPASLPAQTAARAAVQQLRAVAARTPLRKLARLARPVSLSLDRPEPWVYDILEQQARWYEPDVVFVQAMDVLDARVLHDALPPGALLVGQTTAYPTPGDSVPAYDLVLSSLPSVVEQYRELGVRAELHHLGFDPRVRDAVPERDRDIPVSFVGSAHPVHAGRVRLLELLLERLPELQVWVNNAERLPKSSSIRARNRGAVFGRAMYEVLRRSRITINHHDGAPAERYANNLRLYEATGMGALLVTDWKENLGELFEVGSEVGAYSSDDEAYEIISAYLRRPMEVAAIAAAGEARTLRAHTYHHRMSELVASVEALRA